MTYWESDNKSDNEPVLTIDFAKDVIINYVDLWPVLLDEEPKDAYAKICINIQKAWWFLKDKILLQKNNTSESELQTW